MKNSYMKYLVILLSLFISQLSIAASNLKINQLIQTVSQKSHRSKISSKMKEECLGYCALKIRHGEYDRSVLYFMDDSKELLSIYASKDNGQTWNNITDESSELRIESDNVLHENFWLYRNSRGLSH